MNPDFISKIVLYFQQGGFVMYPLGILTVVLWYALGYRFSILDRGSKRSLRILCERIESGREKAEKGIIVEAVRTAYKLKKEQSANIKPLLDEEILSAKKRLKSFNILINSIVIVAPLLGLLGTVTGMIETFDSLADTSMFSQTGGIAGGISEALFTTQMGLVVAIPGLFAGKFLEKKARTMLRELYQLKDMVCGKPEIKES